MPISDKKKKEEVQPTNELKWVRHTKIDPSKMAQCGDSHLIYGHGSALTILNINDNTEEVYRIARPHANGVSCVGGHRSLTVFAYAEHSNVASIVIVSYPDFRVLGTLRHEHSRTTLEPKCTRRIVSMAFSETEHLAVLTGYPDFMLELWNWRTQRMLTERPTAVTTDKKYCKFSRSSHPMAIAEIAYLGHVNVWEVHLGVDAAALIKRTIPMPGDTEMQGPFNLTILADNSSYITNRSHSIWSINYATRKITLIIDADRRRLGAQSVATVAAHGRRASRMSSPELFSNIESIRLRAIVERMPDEQLFLFGYRGGLLMIERHGVTQMYRKCATTGEWLVVFKLDGDGPVLAANCFGRNDLVEITASGLVRRLMHADDGTVRWHTLRDYDRDFQMLVIVQPMGDLIVTVNSSSRVGLLKVATGQLLDNLQQPDLGTVKCLVAFQHAPAIAIGNASGFVYLYSLFQADHFQPLAAFHLCDFAIERVCVGHAGKTIVALDESRALFVIRGDLGEPMHISNHIQLQDTVISMAAYTLHEQLTIVALVVPIVAPGKHYTDTLIQLRVADGEGTVSQMVCTLPKEYISIAWTWPQEAELELDERIGDRYVAVPYLSNYFDVVELAVVVPDVVPVVAPVVPDDVDDGADGGDAQETDDVAIDRPPEPEPELRMTVLLSQQTIHRVCLVKLGVYRDFIMTWSQDGGVQMWAKSPGEWLPLTFLWAMNHFAMGVREAVTDPFRQFIITLGSESNLQCLHHSTNAMDTARMFTLRQFQISKASRQMFNSPTGSILPLDRSIQPISWVQQQQTDRETAERDAYSAERRSILSDLTVLRAKLKQLIDANELAPDDERLDIGAFDLDVDGTIGKQKAAQRARNADELAIKAECAQLQRLSQAIVAMTWDRMSVKGRKLCAIFSRLRVENYALLLEPAKDDDLVRAQLWRTAEQLLEDTFQPWQPLTDQQLSAIAQATRPQALRHSAGGDALSERSAAVEAGSSSSSAMRLAVMPKHSYTLTGTSSHNYIVPIAFRYKQLEVVSYYQMVVENILGFHDTLALRRHFNQTFERMAAVKGNDVALVLQRNNRLRHIQSELNQLERLKGSDRTHESDIVDPEYAADEQPDRIVRVEPHELTVTPYVSPSEQALIDAAAADAERRRLAMLADDFRERALMRMMNGVLEVRWEDEIKKVPPQPDCLTGGKNPKDFTPEDLGAIAAHEALVQHLADERERYHGMLLEEQEKIDRTLFDQIQKFNHKVGETLMEKIKVEFAIASEDLKLLRNHLFNFERLRYAGQEVELQQESDEIRRELGVLSSVVNELEDSLATSRGKYEELNNKDRQLDRQFKNGYGEFASKAVVDQAYRIFKRRPKWAQRAGHTASILTDMARRIVQPQQQQQQQQQPTDTTGGNRSGMPLPDECWQYLEQVEQVDKVSNAPAVLDAHQWQVLCRMRRVKLEMEFRVRAVGAQIADTETALNAFLREINLKRAKLARLDARELDLRRDRDAHLEDRTVQLCMRRGIVEVPLSGHMSDFDNAILLHSTDVHDINAIIKKAGMKKLKTMENAAIFRRKITFIEWEHLVLRLKIEEKQVAIKCIQRSKITKEVQKWLKWKSLGWKDDISENALKREIEASRQSLEAMCNDIIKKTNETNRLADAKRRSNGRLDSQILHINLDVAELQLARNVEQEKLEVCQREKRLTLMTRRSRLVREIQQNHARILELCTMLELQRLRTFPTLTRASPRPAMEE